MNSQCGAGIRLKINDLIGSRWERPYAPVCDESETTLQVQLPKNGESIDQINITFDGNVVYRKGLK